MTEDTGSTTDVDFSTMESQLANQEGKKSKRESRKATIKENIALYTHTLVSLIPKIFNLFEENAGILVAEEIISIVMKGTTVVRLAGQTREATLNKEWVKAFLYLDLTTLATTNYIQEQVNKVKAQQLKDYTTQLKAMRGAHGI